MGYITVYCNRPSVKCEHYFNNFDPAFRVFRFIGGGGVRAGDLRGNIRAFKACKV